MTQPLRRISHFRLPPRPRSVPRKQALVWPLLCGFARNLGRGLVLGLGLSLVWVSVCVSSTVSVSVFASASFAAVLVIVVVLIVDAKAA